MRLGLFLPEGQQCHIRKVVGELRKLGHEPIVGATATCDAIFGADVTVAEEADRAGKEFGKPVCQQVLDLPVWRFEDPFFKVKYERYRAVLGRAAKVVANSAWVAKDLRETWGIDSEPIGNPVDDQAILSAPDPSGKENQVIAVGRFDLRKRFHVAIQAISLLSEPVEFVLVGIVHLFGPELYTRVAREYGVKIRIMVSASDDVKFTEIKKSKALLAPSTFEGLGLPPIEAILCGTPVVVNDMPVTREVLGDGIAWCDGKDPKSIATALEPLLRSAEKGMNMVEALRPKMKYFFMDSYARRLAATLEGMVEP